MAQEANPRPIRDQSLRLALARPPVKIKRWVLGFVAPLCEQDIPRGARGLSGIAGQRTQIKAGAEEEHQTVRWLGICAHRRYLRLKGLESNGAEFDRRLSSRGAATEFKPPIRCGSAAG